MDKIIDELKKNSQIIKFNSYNVFFSYIEKTLNNYIDKYVNSEIFGIYDIYIIFIIETHEKIKVIIKSANSDIDINKLKKYYKIDMLSHNMISFESSIKSPDILLKEILNNIDNICIPKIRAQDIMSSPVRTVLSEEPIEKIYKLMIQTGHSGFPIIEKNELIGIVTKKDVEKAINHGLEKEPIKKIMSKKIISVSPETSIEKIREIMAENGIGRILVLNKENLLIGIITRSDLIKGKFFHKSPAKIIIDYTNTLHKKNILKKMLEIIEPKYLNLLRLLGIYGAELNFPVYVVGGFVRDLLLGKKNYDIDIVIEGDGLKYAKYVSKNLRTTFVEHKEFHTGSLFFKDGFRIDIATARVEYYEKPADLPKVEISTIKKDLYRRDFSINAMAIKLNPEEFGVLFDFFGCQNDLENGIIRILYNLSFIEDPTRILRAIRFERRFNFKIEERTLELMKEAINNNYIEKVTGMRLREELEKILSEKNVIDSIIEMGELSIFDHLFWHPKYKKEKVERFKKILKFKKWFENKCNIKNKKIKDFHIFLYSYLACENGEAAIYATERYGLPKKFINNLNRLNIIIEKFKTLPFKWKNSDFYNILGDIDDELKIVISGFLTSKEMEEKYIKYLKAISNLELKITGKDIIKKGISGKKVGEILEYIKIKKLDGEIQDEKEFLERLVISNE
ncbi:CBS domain-containing protein [Marinitoga sp. 1137]|uniref:CBS domain-containing protein n=1 Tax=Marinitoga sp. 1137 TaxID=1545835 RepID=UPI000951CCF3|nr:CBS domain-containing protein [Marinitoga sp. 1137]